MGNDNPPPRARGLRPLPLQSLRLRARLILLLLTYSLLLFGLGYIAKKERWIPVRATINSLKTLPARLGARLQGPPPPGLVFELTATNLLELGAQRDRAFERSLIIATAKDYVPATLWHGDEALAVEMRLKGDSLDHLEGDKWSFRVRVRDGKSLFGMKEFSLQHPKTRNYLYEWLFHRALSRAGLIALRYEFLTVTLNGTDLGIYALEEHFDERLIEHNRLPAGPIVRFNEDLFWQELADQKHSRAYNIFATFTAADIDTFQTGEIFDDPEAAVLHRRAVRLLEAFRRGDLKSSEVFDLDKVTTFFALVDLVGAQHSVNWTNMRFYYNPITSRLEAIGFDGDAGKRIRGITPQLSPLVEPGFIERLFEDLLFYEEYLRKLRKVSDPTYLDVLLTEIDETLRRNNNFLLREFPEFVYSPSVLEDNATFIRNVLNPTQAVHAYLGEASPDVIELQIGNIQFIPIEVVGISSGDSEVIPLAERVLLPHRAVFHVEPPAYGKITSTHNIEYKVVTVPLPEGVSSSPRFTRDLRVHYRLLGEELTRAAPVLPTPILGGRLRRELPFQTSTIDSFDFLTVDETTHRILIQPGDWVLERGLVIPAGYRVIASAGTRLNLRNGAMILSRSDVEFVGTPEQPIVIGSDDRTGQGLAVLDAPRASALTNVVFEDLASPRQNGWKLSAAVTFYRSPVGIFNSTFSRTMAGDALNIIGADFSIEQTQFRSVAGHAIDIAFSKGTVKESVFEEIGHDAIHLSGTIAQVEHSLIKGAEDRGVSAGARSHLFLEGVEFQRAYVAVAVGDSSHLTAKDLQVLDSHHGIVAFRERLEFGPAVLELERIEFENVALVYLLEKGSQVTVDSTPVSAEQEHVLQALYGGGGAALQ